MAKLTKEISNSDCLENGTRVYVNIPFEYEIGEEGPTTGNILRTVEDCENEVRAELDNGVINGVSVLLTSMVKE